MNLTLHTAASDASLDLSGLPLQLLEVQDSVSHSETKKETEIGFPDYIEKAETGAVSRALALCGYGMLQAPEFDEQDRLADTPVEKNAN